MGGSTAGNRQPKVHVCGVAKDRVQELRIDSIWLNIAHCWAYATAQAIAARDTQAAEPDQK